MRVCYPMYVFLFAWLPGTQGHGAVTFPPPRNAIDSDEMPWGGKVPAPVPFEPWCPYPSAAAAGTDPNGVNLTGANGQACFWFSNGCAIGCDECDGSTRGPEVGTETRKVCYPGSGIKGTPMNATVCDPSKRTVNT